MPSRGESQNSLIPLLSFLPEGDNTKFGLSAGAWNNAFTRGALMEWEGSAAFTKTASDGALVATYVAWGGVGLTPRGGVQGVLRFLTMTMMWCHCLFFSSWFVGVCDLQIPSLACIAPCDSCRKRR